MNQHDRFQDVVGGSAGIFDGTTTTIAGAQGGLTNFDNLTTTQRQDGVAVGMQCRGCGRPVEMLVEYPELVCVKYGVSPHLVVQLYRGQDQQHPNLRGQFQSATEWVYTSENQGWSPNQFCSCRTWAAPIFTPEEAERLLAKARRSGWIDLAGEKMMSMAAYDTAKQARGQLNR
jgi:hypothetical protein